MAEKPRTQREMIYQVWYAVLGTDGDGLVGQVREIKAWINKHPQVCPFEVHRKGRLRRIATIAGVGAAGATMATLGGKVLGLW
jgi:hypothetical protein